MPEKGEVLEIGKGRMIRQGTTVAILSLGTRLVAAQKAAEDLAARGLSVTVADARFAKPIDTALVRQLAADHEVLITVEEGSRGGFGAHVLHYLAEEGLLDHGLKVRTMCFPDRFIEHDKPDAQIAMARLTPEDIVETALKALGRTGAEVAGTEATGASA